jgi:hypothetical protein
VGSVGIEIPLARFPRMVSLSRLNGYEDRGVREKCSTPAAAGWWYTPKRLARPTSGLGPDSSPAHKRREGGWG